jgi:hypothetical protein
MPAHNIIHERRRKLVDNINQILGTTESARFAVGYFFYRDRSDREEKLAASKFDSD